ncbi:TetR/AcrR family transcriptional regulator [Nocardia cyriacigeorgica]|uniref:TetR/AcrR family transcriptional regulator n=1 Tax=Nocardia cyriacigeorgica TaxID=135487 RepID=A0A5R8NRT8_9NOCA|nr:TetR/AcrR family transcriptional regulator [Nocardia cyriacigeorgica]TLF77437.1 TetR/AcrR family transcriptional regulator [Nocardia cyriacigeorgica]
MAQLYGIESKNGSDSKYGPSYTSSVSAEQVQSEVTRAQRKAAANRRAVVDAARVIVAESGADALTLEAVAERADVAVQTIYNRVGGRSALLTAVAEQAMEESRAYMDEAYATPGTPEERLTLAAEAYARFARERPHEFRILVEPPDEPTAIDRIVELTRTQNAKLAAAIHDGIATGDLRRDLDPDDLAAVFLATINGLLALAWRPGALGVTDEELDRLLATYVSTVADGLRVRPAG